MSNFIWNFISRWNFLAKKTIGAQYADAIDSISALIAEGFGRFAKKDKIHFYRMARGSTLESLDWTQKAKIRKLLTKSEYDEIFNNLKALPLEINQLIKFTNLKLKE